MSFQRNVKNDRISDQNFRSCFAGDYQHFSFCLNRKRPKNTKSNNETIKLRNIKQDFSDEHYEMLRKIL